MGDEFIPMVNKGGGAGLQVTAYTQTISDIEAKIGSVAKSGQVQGNFNNIIMMRVRESKTAEILTTQLPKVDIYKNTIVSGATDTPNPETKTDFTSSTQDRISTESMPLLETSEIIQLPKGQAFVLMQGGELWKVRIPLPSSVDDKFMPESIKELAKNMEKNYGTGESWWLSIPTPIAEDNQNVLSQQNLTDSQQSLINELSE
jgi:hypothetical protein